VDSPETALWLSQQRSQVRHILAELSVRDAELLLARTEGLSYQELARNLEIHATSVGKLLARAEDKFRKKYEARYGKE
jgi:RNA polymerase sigma-70 factor, ECF subfamily